MEANRPTNHDGNEKVALDLLDDRQGGDDEQRSERAFAHEGDERGEPDEEGPHDRKERSYEREGYERKDERHAKNECEFRQDGVDESDNGLAAEIAAEGRPRAADELTHVGSAPGREEPDRPSPAAACRRGRRRREPPHGEEKPGDDLADHRCAAHDALCEELGAPSYLREDAVHRTVDLGGREIQRTACEPTQHLVEARPRAAAEVVELSSDGGTNRPRRAFRA